jgi:AraC-like DNA-binding protein
MYLTASYEEQSLCRMMRSAYSIVDRPILVLRERSTLQSAIARMTSQRGFPDPVEGLNSTKAFLIAVHLVASAGEARDSQMDGRAVTSESWAIGGVTIYDLDEAPPFFRTCAFDCVHYYLPRATIDAYTDSAGLARIGTLRCPNGKYDHVLYHLAQALLPMLAQRDLICEMYLNHYLPMLCAYLVRCYGSVRPPKARGGLAPWQRRCVTNMIRSDLRGDASMSKLAETCGLSVSHFARCFRTTFGIPVHRYVVQERIEAAKRMLLYPGNSLTQIALETGFSDQAAFGRTFGSLVGLTPAKWRKERLYATVQQSAPIMDGIELHQEVAGTTR